MKASIVSMPHRACRAMMTTSGLQDEAFSGHGDIDPSDIQPPSILVYQEGWQAARIPGFALVALKDCSEIELSAGRRISPTNRLALHFTSWHISPVVDVSLHGSYTGGVEFTAVVTKGDSKEHSQR